MDAVGQSGLYFEQGYTCAQSVARGFAAELGLDPDVAARLAAAFGAGMGRTGHTCGAVSGALMVIGWLYGASDPADKAAKEHTYALAANVLAEFALRHGSTDCTTLTGCDLSSPAGMQTARDQGVFKTRCPQFVSSAAQIVNIIRDQELLDQDHLAR